MSTIDDDAERVFATLAAGGDAEEQGHHEFTASELATLLRVAPRRLNDVVALLRKRGVVDVEPGTTRDFSFAAVSLNATGRHIFESRTSRISASAHDLASSILKEVSTRPLSVSLREARRLAAQVGNEELKRFVGIESDGYYENTMPTWGIERVPDYRTIGVKPVDVSGAGVTIASADLGFLNQYTLRNAVHELEELVSAAHPEFASTDPLWVESFNSALAKFGRHLTVQGGSGARPLVKGFVFEKPAVRGVLARVADRLVDLVDLIARQPSDVSKVTIPREDEPTIAVITALDEEAVAVQWALGPMKPVHRTALGRLRRFDLAEVPSINGRTHLVAHFCVGKGNTRAANRAAALLAAFPSIEYIVMCGIAGAVPHPSKSEHHVRLGDVIVSNEQGVIEFNVGNDEPDKFVPKHPVRAPAAALLDAVAELRREALSGKQRWLELMRREPTQPGAVRPPADLLVDGIDVTEATKHPDDPLRRPGVPRVFEGPIASSNAVLKDPKKRDALRDRYSVKAVEMEGAGIAEVAWDSENGFLVVRGACDYCNPNKGDDWHPYAAYVAAAYCRALVDVLPC